MVQAVVPLDSMGPGRSAFKPLEDPRIFWWATGIEDTFITAPWPKTGRTLDEYELTGHYDRWREDLDLAAELGIKQMRYGIPWHRVNPHPGKWDWDWPDRTLGRLLELGIDPIVDLVHYGAPSWIEGAFVHPDFPARMAEYASRLAERFKGRIYYYTPLNEPRVTAWYCGKLGWWPPFQRGWTGFLRVMLGVSRGIVETVAAMRRVDPEIVDIHVDATDLYESAESALQREVEQRQAIVFLALDLVSGRVDSSHGLFGWLLRQGVREEELEWFREHRLQIPAIGVNLYPMFSQKVLSKSSRGLRIRMPYAGPEIIRRLGRMYADRYGCPLMISETASVGPVKRRRDWLVGSVQAVRECREEGIPIVGYTWWPLFALVTWAYRQGNRPAAFYLKQMGLWDLDPVPEHGLARVRTPLVDLYRGFVASGWKEVGQLNQRGPRRMNVS